jgi:hypothetical protein
MKKIFMNIVVLLGVLTKSFGNPSITSGNPPNSDYKIIKLTGVQVGGNAGNRSSDSLIKIVKSKNASQVHLTASDSGKKEHNQPAWSGNGVKGEAGNLNAEWSGFDDSTATAYASNGYSSLNIAMYNPLESSFTISKESSGSKNTVDQINSWLTKYSKTPTWKISGGFDGDIQRCDFYENASKIGYKAKARGFIKIEAPEFSIDAPQLPTSIPGLYWVPIGEFSRFSLEGNGEFEFNEEKSQPWIKPFQVNIEGGVSVTAGVKFGAGNDKIADASISAEGNCSIKSLIVLGHQERDITFEEYKITFGELTGKVILRIKLVDTINWQTDLVDHTFWEGQTLPKTKSPESAKVLFSIPMPE